MMDDGQDDQGREGADWLTGLAAAGLAAGAIWLGKKIFGSNRQSEMTHERALEIIRDFPVFSTPGQREELARATAFLEVEQRRKDGFPVDEDYSKELADLRAQCSFDMSSDGHRVLQASKDLIRRAQKDLASLQADLRRRGIKVAPPENPFVICPRCEGRQNIDVRNYFGVPQSLPCPRCNGRGRVRVDD
jgi:hypothetical protein